VEAEREGAAETTAGEPTPDRWTPARKRLAAIAPDASIALAPLIHAIRASFDQAGIPIAEDALLAWLAGAAWYAGAFDPEPAVVRFRRVARAEEVACILHDQHAGGRR
jgi:hypothetical protein